MKESTRRTLLERLMPQPQELTIADGDFVDLGSARFLLSGSGGEEIVPLVRERLKAYWNIAPELRREERRSALPAEGYALTVEPGKITLEFADASGVRHALNTLRQIAEPPRARTVIGWLVPRMSVRDWPSASFRGVHLCVFPETERIELEKQIRFAAYLKLNYVLLESWGTFPFPSEPDFCWPNTKYSCEDFRYLVELGRSLGVSVCPGVNLVGHATWATGGKSGKFAVLDFHPEYAPLFDPDGWCWCLSNPETRKVLTRLIHDMCDVFDNPPYFHIGCDEADSLMTCSVCAEREPLPLLRDHLLHLHSELSGRGVRMMMWHDMLVDRNDPRWRGFTAFGLAESGTPELYRDLPHDIVICDWEYDRVLPDRDFPISKFFQDQGFTALLCGSADVESTARMGRSVRDNKFGGMLGTTWLRGSGRGFFAVYHALAHAAWNPGFDYSVNRDNMPPFNTYLRQIDQDAGIQQYEYFGRLNHYQQPPDKMLTL